MHRLFVIEINIKINMWLSFSMYLDFENRFIIITKAGNKVAIKAYNEDIPWTEYFFCVECPVWPLRFHDRFSCADYSIDSSAASCG